MDFIEELRAWASANQLLGAMVKFEEGPPDRPKRSAIVIAETRDASGRIDGAGQLTVWETGECDVSAEALSGETLLSRTRVLSKRGEVSEEADGLLAQLMRSCAT